eukprot:946287-Amphidinium_carterae.1
MAVECDSACACKKVPCPLLSVLPVIDNLACAEQCIICLEVLLTVTGPGGGCNVVSSTLLTQCRQPSSDA